MAGRQKGNKVKSVETGIPEGYENAQAERSSFWYSPDMRSPLEGLLLGRFPRTKGNGYYYQIRAVKSCDVVQSIEGESVEAVANPGQIVNVDERKALECFQACLDVPHMVFVQSEEKITLDNGQSFWRFRLGKRRATLQESESSKVPF